MLKRLLVTAALVVAAGSMVGVSTVRADEGDIIDSGKVTICHRTNAANNPYESITVDKSAVDGQGNNDHTQHTGPVATSFAVATALKKDHKNWGDIIPAFDNYPGYNVPEGQAILDKGCKFPGQEEMALVDYELVCDVNNHQAVITFTNTGDIAGSATVNGENVNVPLDGAVVSVPTAVTGTQVTIVIDEVTVYDQLVTCEPGKGAGETPVTPTAATPAASLPFTANNTPVVALVASAIATVTAVVSVIVKSALVKQL